MPPSISASPRPRRAADTASNRAGGVRSRGVLSSLIGYHLRLAQIAVFRDFADTLQAYAATPGRFGLLVLIRANPGLSQSRLAEAIGLDRSSLVPALNKLERHNLVERRASREDRRSNGIWLTAQGAALLSQMQRRVAMHERRLLHGFSATDKMQLIQMLERIQRNLGASTASTKGRRDALDR